MNDADWRLPPIKLSLILVCVCDYPDCKNHFHYYNWFVGNNRYETSASNGFCTLYDLCLFHHKSRNWTPHVRPNYYNGTPVQNCFGAPVSTPMPCPPSGQKINYFNYSLYTRLYMAGYQTHRHSETNQCSPAGVQSVYNITPGFLCVN